MAHHGVIDLAKLSPVISATGPYRKVWKPLVFNKLSAAGSNHTPSACRGVVDFL